METRPALELMLGPAFLGSIAVSVLFGVMVLQGYIYYSHSQDDSWGLKTLISCLCILEVSRLALILHAMYMLFVRNFGNPGFLTYPIWSMVALAVPGHFIEMLVRWAFAQRIHSFCKSRGLGRLQTIFIPITIGKPLQITLSIVATITGSLFVVERLTLHMTEKANAVSVFLYIHFSCSMGADFIAAAALCTALFQSRTGIKSSRADSIVHILMAFAVNTGLFTGLVTTACFVTYVASPNTLIWMGLLYPKSQLYINSLLASLNARQPLRDNATISHEVQFLSIHVAEGEPLGLQSSENGDDRLFNGGIQYNDVKAPS
ncbi:hypothetical protein CPB83DRAFT_903261 [Crepidotus variabilis]|uniref:DUF6534 domain-containing protein n=1 Tax=Crepidotus variabilis TaxID=179855 RepID=A0A9P6ERF7_9AGAR|nr:hypothetical protein CPB83DRAFT_903261 [Crepidotus variabilis]